MLGYSAGPVHWNTSADPPRTLFCPRQDGDGTAETSIHVRAFKSLLECFLQQGEVPHCFASFATLWHTFACLRSTNSSGDAASAVCQVSPGLHHDTPNTSTFAHTDRVALIQHPSIHGLQGQACTVQSHPALGSPLLGPTAVLGMEHYTKQHQTESKAERRANSLSRHFLVPTQGRQTGCTRVPSDYH